MCSCVLHTPFYLTFGSKSHTVYVVRGPSTKVRKTQISTLLSSFLQSKRALTMPMTYLILFSSLMMIISVTYSLAITQINAGGSLLKASLVKENMQGLDDAIRSVAWKFKASKVICMDDCGGSFQTHTTGKNLLINFTDDQSFHDVVFNTQVGRVCYELESSQPDNNGFFIRGDARSITNQSWSTMTQIYYAQGDSSQELVLSYRPSANSAVITTDQAKPQNLIRLYIINLNSSQSLTLNQKFYLKVTSLDVTLTLHQYEFNQSISSLGLISTYDDASSTVWIPISSTAEGAFADVEIIVCSIRIQRLGI